MTRGKDGIINYASQRRVQPDKLAEATAEMINAGDKHSHSTPSEVVDSIRLSDRGCLTSSQADQLRLLLYTSSYQLDIFFHIYEAVMDQ